uniref:Uncharacterized protein n=1 Tax=Ixodes ricinus TaxID=34613 RepID=A0A147BLI4_IXORI
MVFAFVILFLLLYWVRFRRRLKAAGLLGSEVEKEVGTRFPFGFRHLCSVFLFLFFFDDSLLFFSVHVGPKVAAVVALNCACLEEAETSYPRSSGFCSTVK